MSTATTATQQMYINGRWIDGPDGQTRPSIDPATGRQLGQWAYGNADLAAEAVQAAVDAFPAWSRRPAVERAHYLSAIAARLRDQLEPIARLMTQENGKTLRDARAEVNAAAAHFDWYAGECQRIYGRTVPPAVEGKRHVVIQQPVGVTAAITPWNFPLMLWARKIAPALGAGCTVVSRPASATMLTTMAGLRCCVDAGLPAGVLNLVTGPADKISDVFIDAPECRKITFTGSTEVGQDIATRAGVHIKRLSLELGGQAPAVVLADADLDLAVEQITSAKMRNNGQSCIAINRVFVEEPVAAEFERRLTHRFRTLKVANGLDETADVSTLINQEGMEKVLLHVEDAVARGAELQCGGIRLNGGDLDRGYFVAPTVLTGVADDMLCMCEETFGPVLPVSRVKDRQEAVARANALPFGLCAYLYTRSMKAAFEVSEALEAGTIAINDAVPSTTIAPFGGMKLSGLGRECGREGIEAFLETKHLSFYLG